jgi:hypothetical protein
MLAAYALLSFVSLRWYQVFVDEPAYTDPAASLLTGQGFTSGAWYAQGYEGFWAGNVPLHQACLYLWMKVFGIGQVAVRSLNILFVVAGVGLLWAAVKRLGILKTPGIRLATIALILCSHAGAVWVDLGRPDAICVALAGLTLFAFSLENRSWRFTLLGLAGAATPWAAIPLALVIGFAGVVLLLCWRTRFLGEVLCLAAGGLAGTVALLALYQSQGVLDAFLQSILPHSSFFARQIHCIPPPVAGLKQRLGGLLDYTLLCLIAASAFGWLASWREREARPLLVLSFLSLAGVPLLLAGAGVFPIYYAWFALVPGLVALMALWERGLIRKRLLQAGLLVSLACLVLLGFPRVWATGFLYRADDVNGRSERFVASVLHADDLVLTQPQAWYGAKASASKVYNGYRAPNLTPAEAASITAVISSPAFFYAQRNILTGEWTECPEQLSVPNRNTHRLPFSKWFRDNPMLELHVFRRASH